MGDNSKIEWTDATWNVVTGCTRVSPGCDNCYMFAQWPWLHGMGSKGYEGPVDRVELHRDRLDWPLTRWKAPRKIFTASMGDLFHSDVPWDFLLDVFTVMARTPQHSYQVLTKRPGRMLYFARNVWPEYQNCHPTGPYPWPPNVWAGTSVESKKYLPRLDLLAQVPARVRFVSAEPLLEAIDLRPWLPGWLGAGTTHENPRGTERYDIDGSPVLPLDWVITGGESGPDARPMHPDLVRSIRDQCWGAGVPFFFKQWGEWAPEWMHISGPPLHRWDADLPGVLRVGKKAAGAMLDGREWREFPDG